MIARCIIPPTSSSASRPPSPMSHASNALTVGSHQRTDASAAPGTVTDTTRHPPDILTYCYDSRMRYVTPGEDYDVCSFLPTGSTPCHHCSSIDSSSEPSISPSSPSQSSQTLDAIRSVWRSASYSTTSTRRRQPKSAPRPGRSLSPGSRGSKSWRYASHPRPSPPPSPRGQHLLVPCLRWSSHLLRK